MAHYVYSEDPYQHITKIEIDKGRPYVKAQFGGKLLTPTFSGVSLTMGVDRGGGGPNLNIHAWGIVPFGGTVGIDVPPAASEPLEFETVLVSLFVYPNSAPGALEAEIAAAAGDVNGNVQGYEYDGADSIMFLNTNGYRGSLEDIITYSGPVFSLDELGRLTSQVLYIDDSAEVLHTHIVTYDPPLHPILHPLF